jgi:hypothetical protein
MSADARSMSASSAGSIARVVSQLATLSASTVHVALKPVSGSSATSAKGWDSNASACACAGPGSWMVGVTGRVSRSITSPSGLTPTACCSAAVVASTSSASPTLAGVGVTLPVWMISPASTGGTATSGARDSSAAVAWAGVGRMTIGESGQPVRSARSWAACRRAGDPSRPTR